MVLIKKMKQKLKTNKQKQMTTNTAEDVHKREHESTWWECKPLQLLWKLRYNLLSKIKVEIPMTIL